MFICTQNIILGKGKYLQLVGLHDVRKIELNDGVENTKERKNVNEIEIDDSGESEILILDNQEEKTTEKNTRTYWY